MTVPTLLSAQAHIVNPRIAHSLSVITRYSTQQTMVIKGEENPTRGKAEAEEMSCSEDGSYFPLDEDDSSSVSSGITLDSFSERQAEYIRDSLDELHCEPECSQSCSWSDSFQSLKNFMVEVVGVPRSRDSVLFDGITNNSRKAASKDEIKIWIRQNPNLWGMLGVNLNLDEEECIDIATRVFMTLNAESEKSGYRDRELEVTVDQFKNMMAQYVDCPKGQQDFFHRQVFAAYDRDASGYLDRAEFEEFLDVFYEPGSIFSGDARLPPKNKLVKILCEKYDANNDGIFSYTELKPIISGLAFQNILGYCQDSVRSLRSEHGSMRNNFSVRSLRSEHGSMRNKDSVRSLRSEHCSMRSNDLTESVRDSVLHVISEGYDANSTTQWLTKEWKIEEEMEGSDTEDSDTEEFTISEEHFDYRSNQCSGELKVKESEMTVSMSRKDSFEDFRRAKKQEESGSFLGFVFGSGVAISKEEKQEKHIGHMISKMEAKSMGVSSLSDLKKYAATSA